MKPTKILQDILIVGAVCMMIYACNGNKQTDIVYTDSFQSDLEITYDLPGDLHANATESELALYAWQEFFALNWQSSWSKDNRRAIADSTWSFIGGGAQPNLAVWETYIHRTELRPANKKRTKNLDTGKPYYSFIDSTRVNVGPNALDLTNYWNVLDEDSEIGSAYVFAHENEYQVLYAAKSNLVEYNYTKEYFPTDSQLDRASAKGKQLGIEYFKSLSKSQMCASDSISNSGLVCLPCGDNENAGAIEIKLAFRKLDVSKGDDSNRFITKEVVVFKENKITGNIDALVDTFGLIGMHIIHKTKNYPAFIFASWEQIDERNNNIQTIGIDTVTVNNIPYDDVDPHRLNPVIERVIPETVQRVNTYVQNKIKSKNAMSKWQFYQLIGVQATPLDYFDRTKDNNYFMANYVIESDLKLTDFHGSFGDPFNTSIQNVAYNKKSYNMGGCQGCHGQAQLKFGTDFSFLLDSGAGKPVQTPDLYLTYNEALKAANPKTISTKTQNKLQAYIKKLSEK